MTNPLLGCRVKINRAKKHLADLKAAIDAFDALHPYGVMIDKKTETGYEVHRFWLNVPIPNDWGGILGDCVHNLRSALDLLAVELIKDGGGTPGDYASFPISSDPVHFRTSAITRINGASADAIKIVEGLKPYSGGEDTFWRLHRLDIADKHQLLIPVAAAHEMFGIKHDTRAPGSEHYPPATMTRVPAIDRKFPLKNGDALSWHVRVTAPGYEDNTEFEFGFGIAFGYGQIFDGEPVVPTLKKLVDFTEGIIDIFARHIFGLASW
jgi:hypothetical protein